MDLLLTADQTGLAESVRTFLAGTHGPTVLRRLDAGPNRDPAIWQALTDMGLPGLCVPENAGGLGLGLLDAALIAVECGRFCVAEPLVDTAFTAAPLLASTPGTDEILQQIAAGTARIALAHPINPCIADLETATHWLGTALSPVTSGRFSVVAASVDPLRNLSARQDTPANPGLLDHAALMTAAQLIGIAEAMLQQATDYAKLRTQFGQPIGAFQAVKHQLATAAVGLEFARPAVWVAAQSLQDRNPHAPAHISHAKIAAGDAATSIAETAIQVHGAMGYTYEVDLHFWMKRSWALSAAWGDRAFHLARLDAAIIAGGMPIGPQHSFA
ncbi:MAG: acyl-CoA dehydrogenase family protein [Polymorphobacter sp.]